MSGLYIHIPFCKCRCIYCDFYSTTCGEQTKELFAEALCTELQARCTECHEALTSVYIGGGTPSQLTGPQIEKIFHTIRACYPVARDAEITFEANPDDIDSLLTETLLRQGVNRVSLGVQSFDDRMLRFLCRRHTALQAETAVHRLYRSGLENISIDLIYGLPEQDLDGWTKDVKKALQLPVSHLSAYALTYEEDTALWRMLQKGQVRETDDEQSLQMYEALLRLTSQAGFEHYEISNFSLPGKFSRHNSSYWQGVPYIGCGPGAHSFSGTLRRQNTPDLKSYIDNAGSPPHSIETLSEDEKCNELIFTSLRTREGLSLKKMHNLFGEEKTAALLRLAQRHLESGRLLLEDDRLRLSRKGLFVSDDIMSDLMFVDEE